jgi:RNA polymerase sigma-70 factor (ECF subfamily)
VRTDAELVNACLDGEKTAFVTLVKRYERPVRTISLAVCRDYHSAADVSQDAFVTAYQNLSGLRKGSAFGPWLMKITHRCALDFITPLTIKNSSTPSTSSARLYRWSFMKPAQQDTHW